MELFWDALIRAGLICALLNLTVAIYYWSKQRVGRMGEQIEKNEQQLKKQISLLELRIELLEKTLKSFVKVTTYNPNRRPYEPKILPRKRPQ